MSLIPKNLIINKLLETVDKFTNQSSLHPEIQPIPQYNLDNAGKSSNDVEDNITVSSVIYNERNSLLDSVAETNYYFWKKQPTTERKTYNISEHKSIEEQLNEVTLKKKEEYYKFKNSIKNDDCDKTQNNNKGGWPKETIAIIGDSIINGKVMRKRSHCESATFSWVNHGWYKPSHSSNFAEEAKSSNYSCGNKWCIIVNMERNFKQTLEFKIHCQDY